MKKLLLSATIFALLSSSIYARWGEWTPWRIFS